MKTYFRVGQQYPVVKGDYFTACAPAGIIRCLEAHDRAFGLRRTRYRGLPKTHLQHGATAAAINIDRIVAWLDKRPRAMTRISRFAALAPANAYPLGEAAA